MVTSLPSGGGGKLCVRRPEQNRDDTDEVALSMLVAGCVKLYSAQRSAFFRWGIC